MNKSNNKRSILLSVTALLIVFVLVVGLSFSWSEGGSRGYVVSPEITISSGSQLTILADADSEGRINVPTDKLNLAEVSSADGRNFFFPTIDNISSKTTEMTFREGIPADENTKYLSYDFDIEGGDTNTNVYLGSGTVVQCSNQAVMSALRIALFANDGSTPYAIFRPNQMAGVSDSYSPIATITALGDPTVLDGDNKVDTMPFGDYYFGNANNQSLFTINSGELKHLTVAMWLEGTEITGDYNTYKDVIVKLNLDFTTESDTLTKYNFVDYTHGYSSCELESWITFTDSREGESAEYPTMMYVFDNNQKRYYAMIQNTNYHENGNKELSSWTIYLPSDIKDFTFRRYSPDIDNWWNEWNPSMTDIKTDINNEHTFVAICGNGLGEGTVLSGCYGYWKDVDGTYRIYFRNEVDWEDVYCYCMDSNNNFINYIWPGKEMDKVSGSSDLYYIDLKESDNIATIEFNGGKEYTTVYFDYHYDSHNTKTYAYIYDASNNQNVFSNSWPGTAMERDPATGYYKIKIKTGSSGKFKAIVNNGKGTQYPSNTGSGYDGYEGDLGKSYLFKENSFELYNYNFQINNSEYFFNGCAIWYKSPGSNGHWLYLDKADSAIYPHIQ